MKIVYDIVPSEHESFTALGFFDGVHLGHKDVICTAVENAKTLGIKSCVLTFSRRPKSILTGEPDMFLTTESEKACLIEGLGVDLLYILDFAEIMNLDGDEFVKSILIDKLKCKGVVCGFNYHFGKGGSCDSNILAEICRRYACKTISRSPILYDSESVSSSRIRDLLQKGDVLSANKMLGHKFGYKLEVIHGRQLGRTIGVPTINQAFPEGFCLPRFGVYASEITVGNKKYCGVTNIGVKPTVGSEKPVSETWILDYSGDLYGNNIDVRLLDFIRAEQKFASISDLKSQILKDSESANKIFQYPSVCI